MSRRILSVVVTVLGLVLVALAVCSATIWKPGSKVEAKLASGPSQPYVITAPVSYTHLTLPTIYSV